MPSVMEKVIAEKKGLRYVSEEGEQIEAPPEEQQQPEAKQAPQRTYEQDRQHRAQNWKRATSIFKSPSRGSQPKQGKQQARGAKSNISRFFRGSQPRRTPQPQAQNPFFSNFRDFGRPHPLSYQARIGAGSENDRKYIRNRFLW